MYNDDELEMEKEELRANWHIIQYMLDELNENGHHKTANMIKHFMNKAIKKICDKYPTEDDEDAQLRETESWLFR